MALQTKELVRAFKYGALDLPDPGTQFTVEQVKDFWAGTYPELVNATIDGPADRDDKQLYTFKKAVGTKGVELLTGAQLIAAERGRQIEHEGYDALHDDEHTDQSIALAACGYAAPWPLYSYANLGDTHQFLDAWPENWDSDYDKRPRDDEGLLPACDQEPDVRIRCLVKAGALIAAEIDRLHRTLKPRPAPATFPAGEPPICICHQSPIADCPMHGLK